ncbi:ran guanine nucleotide release factor [Erpetoichthys calabaricus]|uniref:RAN guanine nucleotide release factor n=1 Tax=Erpetoichthys calabaricus TaxID=27687 RepID=A0A8C4SDV4_ERPCA|nr:ran guanine nucleotide release factor [Erpetoichthys calabaricus]XP_051781396.1 ran guanine nucleotide release factor [Erpetoichthys calabaricus]
MQSIEISGKYFFSGYFSGVLPHGYKDISEVRDIPDNQEVFVHPHTDQSIIIELLEYQEHVGDAVAAKYHFEDLASSNEASNSGNSEVISVEPISKEEISLQECSSAWFLTGRQLVAKFNEEVKNTVNIYLGLFRLPQYTTDIVISFNDPVVIHPLSSSATSETALDVSTPSWTVEQFRLLLQTFRLLNSSVFG